MWQHNKSRWMERDGSEQIKFPSWIHDFCSWESDHISSHLLKIVWNQQPLKGISRSDHLTQCSFINQWTRLRKLMNLRRSGTTRKDNRQLGVPVLMNDTCAAIEIHWIYPPHPVTVANEGLWGSLTKDIKVLLVTVTEWGAYPRYIYIYSTYH